MSDTPRETVSATEQAYSICNILKSFNNIPQGEAFLGRCIVMAALVISEALRGKAK